MSQSRELQLHIAQMEEIRSILNSMKNLALIEIHKLARFQTMQGQAVANIEKAALDFLDFYSLPATDDKLTPICILLGSERGFCGDFNESLINAILTEAYSGIIAIGSRLCSRLADHPLELIATIEGASTAEEVPVILNRLIDAISSLPDSRGGISHNAVDLSSAKPSPKGESWVRGNQNMGKNLFKSPHPNLLPEGEGAHVLKSAALGISRPLNDEAANDAPALQLTVLYHGNAPGQITRRQILPPFPRQPQRTQPYGNPPVLNLEPDEFFSDLTGQYLFAALHEIFYISLMAENQRRLQHLEGAVKHLDDETVNLRRKSQIYRQEEITEEIEVILLNSEIN
jgi:F0F1-type ATP synthase gamma subunit